MTMRDYIHGFSGREKTRLHDQAGALSGFLHGDTGYPPGSRVLEAGCGVGAQTAILARNNPETQFTSIDLSPGSIEAARAMAEQEQLQNVTFMTADIFALPFGAESFDHVFISFVLEHLKHPVEALLHLKRVLKKEGTITVIEGDHGSTSFHPESRAARQIIQSLIHYQARHGGNSLVGRQLFPLLKTAGFDRPVVTPRLVYVDAATPDLAESFTRNTFIAMMEGVRQRVLSENLIDEVTWDRGICDLHATAADQGVFCYTFFKGVACKS
jgi:SAM-dependent methyltransferase